MAMTRAESCARARSVCTAHKEDRQNRYAALIEQNPRIPDKAAARRLGVSRQTIGRYRAALENPGRQA